MHPSTTSYASHCSGLFFCAAIALLLLPSGANAAGLGGLTVRSILGQPLNAEVELLSVRKDEPLTATVASPAVYEQANLIFNGALTGARVTIETRPDGRRYLKATTPRPITEPFLELLIQISSRHGPLTRHYSVLLDPPGYGRGAAELPSRAAVPPGMSVTRSAPAIVQAESTEKTPASEAPASPRVEQPKSTVAAVPAAPAVEVPSPAADTAPAAAIAKADPSAAAPAASTAAVTPRTDSGARTEPDTEAAQLHFYQLRINREEHGVTRVLRLRDGRWFARRADLETWRLRVPDSQAVLFRGEEYYPLDAFAGIVYRFNEPRQELDLEIAPNYFVATEMEASRLRRVQPIPPSLGGFANYDLFFNASEESKRLGGLFELGVFNRHGVGVTNFLVPEVGAQARAIRLDTTWTRDFPGDMKTLTIGDAIGASGVWGRPVRFGGLRYGTNFATNPGFVTFPLPGLRGEAALPTTTELYVNGMLRQSSTLPPGPFHITNLPVITGQGEVRLVVRDLLGREQVINLPYYTSSQLLRAGLIEDSSEVGFIRNNFGIESNDYGRFVMALQRRKGFTDHVTGEARAELLRDQQTVGGGGSVSFPKVGVLTAGAAVSHSDAGSGELLYAAFERQVWSGVSFGMRSQWTSPGFTQLGLQPGQLPPLRLTSGNVGFSAGSYGSLALTFVQQDNRDQPDSQIFGASYSVSVGKSSAFILSAFRSLVSERSQGIFATLSMGLGARRSAFVSYTGQAHANQAVLQLQESLPPGSGTGYRLLAGVGAQGDREEVGFALQTETGTYSVEAGRANGVTALRGSASGGIAVLDGRVFLSRTLTDSFAVARVPGFENVGIYVNNQMVARTDEKGYAMLPRLLPYQSNPIRIDMGNLPLDTRIDTVQVEAAPYFRSGLMLNFPVQRANGALIVLVLEDGMPMPVGSVVGIAGSAEQFPVAERGEAYVTGLAATNRLRAVWRDQSCEVNVDLGPGLGSQPRIGPLTCAGVKR